MKRSWFGLSEIHFGLIAVTCCIIALGVYNLHSAAAAHAPDLYMTQLSWAGAGALGVIVLMMVDYRFSGTVAYVFYAIACVLLVMVLVNGRIVSGSQRWLAIGPVLFQPSEIAKLATLCCVARYFSHRIQPEGYTLGWLVRPLNISRPLAGMAALAMAWSSPWLTDPVQQLALRVQAGVDPTAVRSPSDALWWFRGVWIFLIALCSTLAVLCILRIKKNRELLDPWPPGRARLWLILTGVITAALIGCLGYQWQTPFVRDPMGTVLQWLIQIVVVPDEPSSYAWLGLALRLGFSLVLILYLLLAVHTSIRFKGARLDLFVAPVDILALPAALVLVQPDLGTAGIIGLIGFSIVLIAGIRARSLISLGIASAFLAYIGWFGVLKEYQKQRILTFIAPEEDTMGSGWNAIQSMIAVGSGRWLGKGHMEGTQTQLSFLPEQHTDFAFSVWSEEQGFAGCVLVLCLYLIFLGMALSIASSARDHYGTLLATGVAAMIAWQVLINVGMVIGAFPVVGITLPMFSYGGSSMLTILAGIGLLLSIHGRRKAA